MACKPPEIVCPVNVGTLSKLIQACWNESLEVETQLQLPILTTSKKKTLWKSNIPFGRTGTQIDRNLKYGYKTSILVKAAIKALIWRVPDWWSQGGRLPSIRWWEDVYDSIWDSIGPFLSLPPYHRLTSPLLSCVPQEFSTMEGKLRCCLFSAVVHLWIEIECFVFQKLKCRNWEGDVIPSSITRPWSSSRDSHKGQVDMQGESWAEVVSRKNRVMEGR